jgi:hypothetical protein
MKELFICAKKIPPGEWGIVVLHMPVHKKTTCFLNFSPAALSHMGTDRRDMVAPSPTMRFAFALYKSTVKAHH